MVLSLGTTASSTHLQIVRHVIVKCDEDCFKHHKLGQSHPHLILTAENLVLMILSGNLPVEHLDWTQ